VTRRVPTLVVALALGAGGAAAGPVLAQEPTPQDTSDVVLLDPLVVTADRAETPLSASIGAVTRLEGADLAPTRFAGVGEALGAVPGFTLVDRDGSGLDPQPIVRGFYGGGEAEYVVVLLDGRPLNALQSGLMTWDLVAPSSITAVEVVRGGSSSLYGDAAVAGVVNLITSDTDRPGARMTLAAAGHGLVRGGAQLSRRLGRRTLRIHGSGLRTDGFRDHGRRSALTFGGSIDVVSTERARLDLSIASTRLTADQPGPLPAADLATSRSASDAFYRFDKTSEWAHRIGLDGSLELSDGVSMTGGVTTEVRRSGDVRTIPLAPDFSDTKERTLGTDRLVGAAQVVWDGPALPWPGRVVAGVEGSWGRIDSEYRPVVAGPRPAYLAAAGETGALDASGDGTRRAAAAFAQVEVRPLSALRLSLGVRVDHVGDRFTPRPPSSGETVEATHTAVSPKLGATLRWLDAARSSGSVYASAGRSFKTPTPDQLFDQRSIPLPFPPFSATTSNPTLVPQRGTSLEAGAYQALALGSGAAIASLSLAVYQMDMEDELDFDLATLQYVNIGESRHRGVEASIGVRESGRGSVLVSYALESATSRIGPTDGLDLRAIPRHSWAARVTVPVGPALEAGADLTRASGAWLDAENTIPLDAFTRVDLRVATDVAGGSVFAEVRNVFDERYSSTGFPDPGGSGTVYYQPAAGRTLGVGITLER